MNINPTTMIRLATRLKRYIAMGNIARGFPDRPPVDGVISTGIWTTVRLADGARVGTLRVPPPLNVTGWVVVSTWARLTARSPS